jgi:hypothetical protein
MLPQASKRAAWQWAGSLLGLAAVLAVTVRSAGAVGIEPTDSAPGVRSRQARQLLVNTNPDPFTAPKTTPFDESLALGSPDVPNTDPRVAKRGLACDAPNQIHLTFWTATSVLVRPAVHAWCSTQCRCLVPCACLVFNTHTHTHHPPPTPVRPLQVSWVTCDARTGPSVLGPRPPPGPTSLSYWRAQWQCERFDDHPKSYYAQAERGEADAAAASLDAEEDTEEQADGVAGTAKYGSRHAKHHKKHHKHGEDYPSAEQCGKPARVSGVTTSYYYNYERLNASSNNYASGVIHHVLIKGGWPRARALVVASWPRCAAARDSTHARPAGAARLTRTLAPHTLTQPADLQPGATYFYRVCGEKTCDVKEFKVWAACAHGMHNHSHACARLGRAVSKPSLLTCRRTHTHTHTHQPDRRRCCSCCCCP